MDTLFAKNKNHLLLLLVSFVLWGCSGGSSDSETAAEENALSSNDIPFAYVERSVGDAAQSKKNTFDEKLQSSQSSPLELISPYDFNPGAKLSLRSGLGPEATEQDVLSAYFGSADYDVKDLNVSPDGSQLVFAARASDTHATDSTWNIFLYEFESKTLKRVIEDDAVANGGQDTSPIITAAGDILFSSDRDAGNPEKPRENIELVGDICEKIDPLENPSLLHTMTIDGENIVQRTYGRYNHDLKPSTLKDGRIAFVRWERSYQSLTVCADSTQDTTEVPQKSLTASGLSNPDRWNASTTCQYTKASTNGPVAVTNHYKLLTIGTDKESLQQLYNTVTTATSDESFLTIDKIFQAENGNLFSLVRHQYNPVAGGAMLELEPSHNLNRDTVFTQLSARSLTTDEVDLYPGQLSANGWFSSFWPYRDGSSRLMVSWANCTLLNDGVSSFCSDSNTEGDLDVQYGLWVFDPASDTRSPILAAKNDTVFTDVLIAQPHKSEDLTLDPFDPNFVDNDDATQIRCNFDNTPPLALAGADRKGYQGQTFTLDGSKSSDPDGDPLSFYWSVRSKPDSSTASFDNVNAAKPVFSPDIIGVYEIQLLVNDGEDYSQPDTLKVIVEDDNKKPTANAGPDQTLLLGNTATLNGEASNDPNGSPLTFQWTVTTRPGGSTAEMTAADTATPQFKPDVAGNYIISLIVNDGVYDSAADTVNISVNVAPVNYKPIANAGVDKYGLVNTPISLNGSGSRDPDGDSLTYRWVITSSPGGSNAVLSNAASVSPTLTSDQKGRHDVQLIVNDGKLDSDADTVAITVNDDNNPPLANAGADQSVRVNEAVTLNGSGSSDPDGDALTYRWTMLSQPGSVSLTGATNVQAGFTPTQTGVYVVALVVNDGKLDSPRDTVSVTVAAANKKPVADAGIAQTVTVGDRVSLDGSRSSDPDGDPLTYLWALAGQPDGSSVILTDSNTVNPNFVATTKGVYTVQLIVNDGTVDSDRDTVRITVNEAQHQPVANAGTDQVGLVGDVFSLDGSASTDPDGDALTYLWTVLTQPDGSAANLLNPGTVSPQLPADVAGTYTIQLVVNDGERDSEPDTVTVLVKTPNITPIANAGPDQHFDIDQTLMLDGSGSSDVDGDRLFYEWTIISPANPASTLSDATDVAPTITLTGTDTYVVQLVVYDGVATSAPDTVTLSFNNTRPVAHAGPDQAGKLDQTVLLDGSGSTDVDGDPLTYAWRVLSKPQDSQLDFTDTTLVNPAITLDAVGTFRMQLIVNDGYIDSNPDTMVINVTENTAPVAVAGADQTVNNGVVASLDGSGSFDADNDPLTYRWSLLHKPAASQTELLSPDSVTPTVEIDVYGEYVAQLIVNDGTVDSAPDTIRLTSNNLRPVANAGDKQVVDVDTLVRLDGSQSYDPDGSNINFQWRIIHQPQGSNTTLQNAQTAQPTLTPDVKGNYVVQLIVDDGLLDSYPKTVNVEATDEPTSCELSHATKRTLPVTIRDFKRSHPDFEYRNGVDYGIVATQLGDDGLPVYANTYGSTPTTTNEANFNQWYRDVEGVNLNIPKTITMARDGDSTIWEYYNNSFFPIDGEGWGNTGMTNPDHNFHFTLETHLVFDYKGGETFTFIGDDDLWLYINGRLVIDIGGVHSAIEKSVDIDAVADELGLVTGNRYSFDLFFAERHVTQSDFMFQTNIELECIDDEQ